MSETVYFLTLGLVLGTVLIVFGMRAWSAVQQARLRTAGDDGYRRLAEQAAAGQSGSASALTSLQADVADVRARLAAIENILKAVE